MKKIYLLIIPILMVLLTSCSKSNVSNINFSNLNEKLNNKETFVLYLASKEDDLEDVLSSVLEEYEFDAYKLNIEKLSDDEKKTLKIKYDYADPSIIFIIEGKDPTILSHITDSSIRKSELIARLKDMKYIKEEE